MDKKTKKRSASWILAVLIAVTTFALFRVMGHYFTEPEVVTQETAEQMAQAGKAAVLPVCLCLALDAVWVLALVKVRGVITFWNRRQLICTFDTAKQAEIRRRLAGNGIEYKVQMAGTGAGTGRQGYDISRLRKPEFIIYVHKKDFEKASGVINRPFVSF